ncbi:MAG: redoxin domain-containing protein [Anaerolineae bacterium]|nr:redoxin domain-containing protein [Anaerolineae bacterium]
MIDITPLFCYTFHKMIYCGDKRMRWLKRNLAPLVVLGSNMMLSIAVLGLFAYVQRVQSDLDAVMRVFYLPRVTTDEVESAIGGTNAPDFRLLSTDESEIRLSDYIGTSSVLIAFTSVTCPYCKQVYPSLNTFAQRYPGIQVLVISRGEPSENVDLVSEHSLSFPVLNYTDEVGRSYVVPGTPFFYAIDKEGVIRRVGYGNSLADLEHLAAAIR